jgi:Na+-translocating ferredoxin:NAD+ oxidoreductase subunit A
MDVLKIIFLSLLANNVVLTQFIGVRQLTDARKISFSVRSGISIMLILLLSNCISYLILYYILIPFQIQYLQTLIFIVVIVSTISLIAFFVRKSKNIFFQNIVSDMPLIASNSIILGVCLLIFKNSLTFDFLQMLIYTFSSVAGYMLVIIIISGISEHFRLTRIPKGMKGLPILLISLGILALAFMGLTGIIK